ncbi:hypothetical protein CEP50_16010 [Actinopolyspora mortivallis]|uniref:Glycoside hydrolase n=2 Tax=Actinopolyspora mortivallis TaxID=33906 RepID=A0A2T0GT87_ACTMO|nr:hypothetical protein CEP50_16010 [Actinopolyspora mortivallis]
MRTPGQSNPEEEPRETVDSTESADAAGRRTSPGRTPNAPNETSSRQPAADRVEQLVHRVRTGARMFVRWLRHSLAVLTALAERVARWSAPRLRRGHERLVAGVERIRDRLAPWARRLWLRLSPLVERLRQRCAPLVERARRRVEPAARRVGAKVGPHLSTARAKLAATTSRSRVSPRTRSVQLTAAVAAVGVLAVLVGTVGPDTSERTTPAAHTVDLPTQQHTEAGDPGVLTAPNNDGGAKERAGSGEQKSAPAGKRISPEAAAAVGPNASGIDVSNHNGSIDWNAVAGSGQKYAFVLATDGGTFTNPMFSEQFHGAKQAGLLTGAYHFGRPTGSAVAQADRLMDTMGPTGDGRTLPPVLDLEVSPSTGGCYGKTTAQMHTWTQKFLDRVQERSGQRGIIYASPSFWSTCMGGSQAFAQHPLWLASYGVSQPSVPGGWNNYSFWQYTEKGRVPGISGPVDMNRFQGSGADLLRLAR